MATVPQPRSVDEQRARRLLGRLVWAGIALPVAMVWLLEVARDKLIDPFVPGEGAHVLGALLGSIGVLAFGVAMTYFLSRAQRQLVRQNRDLTAMQAVSSAVRGDLDLDRTIRVALDRLVAETEALAGIVRVTGPGGQVLEVRSPASLAGGLDWARSLLDETPVTVLERQRTHLRAVDTVVLDLPLARGGTVVGAARLLYHPPVDPGVSDAALATIAGEIATAASLSRVVTDLQRRERERAALYEVALRLTRRAELHEVLDLISGHARELLAADGAVICLAERRPGAHASPVSQGLGPALSGRDERLDDNFVCVLGHEDQRHEPGTPRICPMLERNEGDAILMRPLRDPDGLLGEFTVTREASRPFGPAERDLLGALADMAAIAVRTTRLREAEHQWTIVAERDRIARELHDSLAQVLGVIHLRLRALEPRVRRSDAADLGAELSELADVADEAYQDVREAILGLRETIPGAEGLEGALREYLRKFSRQTGIHTSLACNGHAGDRLSPRSEVHLLRVVQEALTNVRKHAQAKRATVALEFRDGAIWLSIEDDGRGFDPSRLEESLDHGFGLASMRERVEQIGGTFSVHTAAGEGTTVVVRLEEEETRATPAASVADPSRR